MEKLFYMVKFKLNVPVIGILRGIERNFFSRVMEASFQSGLESIEVTMNTEGALHMVAENRSRVPQGGLLGMGTIRNQEEAKNAINAGSMFLVTPNYDAQVIEYADSRGIPVIAGALTPTEVYAAWRSGAAMVKVFPCQAMGGPQYIKDIRGPFDHIPMVAVGGVTTENLTAYITAGAQAVGVSSSLFGQSALAEKNIDLLTVNVKNFIKNYLEIKQKLD
jgi:2-dehydro-3-deoxyphosphogluconate aldolase / (4S)-4-hydroxy-2-oxoglutarate aldolase